MLWRLKNGYNNNKATVDKQAYKRTHTHIERERERETRTDGHTSTMHQTTV